MATVYKSLSKTNGHKEEEQSTGVKKNRQRVLILSSRGITYRHRHLLNDVASLLPHGRKDAKLDTKSKLYQLNELAELYNLHTMEELHFTGNCLKGSRPILSFDASFDKEPHLRVIKEVFSHIFGVPKGARKSKPFIDHVMGFTLADGKIWVRNYQINETEPSKAKPSEDDEGEAAEKSKDKSKFKKSHGDQETEINLVEIGPRFVLTPIVIQEGSFGGPIIYENREFVSPNQVRSEIRQKKAGRYNQRAEQGIERLAKKGELGLRTDGGKKPPKDALDTSELFA
ncbi:hypothetical protein B7463_g2916, partial [Scytalidium lignicola]